ncbi:transporter [Psychroflexus sediminis]|uniref:Putative MetA-pathway of phenol degradation n=1 Tax=Psychroflexus sediminis TaxID=470826 RepID=A0A1G7WUZ6_9FLAO|nr:transporter [Psychroflexus sediminis]SDG75748.1 Putative MetA-pathway of phenol degradation [Psychroflexus sediminis]
MKFKLLGIFLFATLGIQAQYTDMINSNRPGESFGAYSVGTNVLQFETGIAYGKDNHTFSLIPDRTQVDFQYQVRFGLFMEQLEVILDGSFVNAEETLLRGGTETTSNFSNFQRNTLGAKYLIYDPFIKRAKEGPNLYSWKKNNLPQWRDLIPAVSLYAGVNLLFGENPFKFPGESNISPKAALITQNNIGRNWVLVSNFIVDKPTSDFPTYAGIFTLTHSIYSRTGVFVEFQTYINDLYSDEVLRAGAAFLVNKNLQVDISGLMNFKDTPERWRAGIGVSYRVDMHDSDQFLFKDRNEEDLFNEERERREREIRRMRRKH